MKELPTEFEGRGEVKGYNFKQVQRTDFGCIYEVTDTINGKVHYEVSRRLENRLHGCVSSPSIKSFGLWAWTYSDLESAQKKLDELNTTQND